MKQKRPRLMTDDLLYGFCLLLSALGAPFVPKELDDLGLILAVLLIVALMYISQKREHLTQEEKRDMERRGRDERDLMVLEKAAWYWTQLEQWLLIGLFLVFGMILGRRDLAYLCFWILTIRWFLLIAIRWWVDRKY